MQTGADRSEAPNAIRTDLGAIFVSWELSRSKMADHIAVAGRRRRRCRSTLCVAAMSPGYWSALRNFGRKRWRERGRSSLSSSSRRLVSTGFWIDRVLRKEGIESHVVDPASITTSRRRRRAKSRRDRRRSAGSRAAGTQARRTSGVRDGESADPRGRGPPASPLSRAQGADRRAGPGTSIASRGCCSHRGISGYQPLRHDRREQLDTIQTGDGAPTGSSEGTGSP